MTDETRRLIWLFAQCRFTPGSWEKRFARDLARKPDDAQLTEKQLIYLGQMVYRYRDQIRMLAQQEDMIKADAGHNRNDTKNRDRKRRARSS